MTSSKGIGLFSKFLWLAILTIVGVIAITTGLAIKQQGALLTSSLIQRNTSLALVVSSQIEAGYLSQRWPFEALKKVSDAEDVLYWWIVEPSGQVHLASSPDMWGKTITNSAVGTRALLVKDDLLPEIGEKIKVIVNPLKIEGEGTPWTFWLGLSLRPIAAAKKRMILTNVVIGLLAIAVGVFLSLLLTRSITRPIKSLVNGTEAIAKGELGHQISITTKDELGELASSFNVMSADLKQVKEEEECRVKQLIALNRASQTVNVSLELDQVLTKIVSLASETVGADYTSVMLVDEANHMRRSTENLPGVPSIEYRIRDEGFTSWIMRSGQAVIIDEIGEDGAIDPDLDEGAPRFVNPYMVKVGVKSVAGLPLRSKDRLLGVVYFHSLQAGTFHDQLSLLVTFANQVAIAVENARLYEKVQQELTDRKQAEEALRLSFIQLAETVSRAMESQDPYTAGHQRQVAELARAVGEKLGLEPDRLQGLYIAGLLHDIGKISIPAEILTHPGKLSDAEWTLISTHPRRGYEILEQAEFPWPVADIALHHHERLDGTGYPDGLKGDQLSLEVRILAVCDVVDAMSSHRPYRSGRPKSEVTAELRAGKGTKYDPKVADILIVIIESGELELAG